MAGRGKCYFRICTAHCAGAGRLTLASNGFKVGPVRAWLIKHPEAAVAGASVAAGLAFAVLGWAEQLILPALALLMLVVLVRETLDFFRT